MHGHSFTGWKSQPWTALGAVVLTLAGLAGGCVKNSATGERIFSLQGRDALREQEIKLGADAAPQMTREFGGAVNSPALRAYLTNLGNRLAATTEDENPKLPWEFTLLDSPVINAFALPGGKVFVSRGLVERMTNEAQLAGVVGHEIAHVTAQHTIQRMNQANYYSVGVAVAGIALSSAGEDTRLGQVAPLLLPAIQVGGQTILLKFGRDEELQADSLGMRYMARAGYNPEAQRQVMQILKDASGGAQQLEILSTHPLPQTRIDRTSALLTGEFAAAAKDPKNQFYEQRFQQQCLAELKRLPPPSPQAQAEALRLMALAGVACTGDHDHN